MHKPTSTRWCRPAPPTVRCSPNPNSFPPMPEPTSASFAPSAPAETPGNVCHLLNDKPSGSHTAVLELRVRNNPGTMSHVTGLFARRGFNPVSYTHLTL